MNTSDEPGKTNEVDPIPKSDDSPTEETEDDPAVTGEIDGD
jgi:hypothetical protein